MMTRHKRRYPSSFEGGAHAVADHATDRLPLAQLSENLRDY
jgi:hypothetical protein